MKNHPNFEKFLTKVQERNSHLRKRHERHTENYEVTYGDYELTIFPGVFNPVYGEGARLMLRCEEELRGRKVLDMGTGSGALAILAAEHSERVTACDISREAVACAKENVIKYNLQDKIDVIKSDLFNAVPVKEKFDIITFNPPFLQKKPSSTFEQSMHDKKYEVLSDFFANVDKYSTSNTEILLCFGEVGNISFLHWLISYHGFTFRKIAMMTNFSLEFFVLKIYKD